MKKLLSWIRITRPVNGLITAVAVILGGVLCAEAVTEKIVTAALAALFAASSGNIINDIFDKGIDRINRPERPIPSGMVTEKEALSLYTFTLVFSMILGWIVNIYAFLIVLGANVLMFLYSSSLKKIPLAGNFTVAFLTGLALVFGGVAAGGLECTLFPALFALLVNFIREVVKDMEDIEGDGENLVVTYPGKYGFVKAVRLVNIVTLFLVIMTAVPYLLRLYAVEYFVFIMVPVNVIFIFFMKQITLSQSKENLRRMSLLLKVNMLLGIAAIFLGKWYN